MVDEVSRDRLASSRLELARLRALAAAAGSVVHDLNNQFSAVLGLASTARQHVRDPAQLKLLDGFEHGTKAGARMVAVLGRLLRHKDGSTSACDPTEFVDDALAVLKKSVIGSGIELTVERPESLPEVRTERTEATQAVLQGLVALVAARPASLAVRCSAESLAVAGGRSRDCAVLRCAAGGLGAAAIEGLARVVAFGEGVLETVAGGPPSFEGLAGAVLIQRRLGGELASERFEGGLQLIYGWPLRAQASRSEPA